MRRPTGQPHTLFSGTGTAVFIALLCAGYLFRTAHADEFAYGAGYFGEYSDNIRRASSAPQSEWIDSVIAGAGYSVDGPVVDAHLLAQAEYSNFGNDTYQDSPIYYADTSLVWHIVPQRFQWFIADRYSQMTQDVTLPDTPDNRVNTNVLSTGPDLYIRFGQANTLELGLRFGSALYSAGDLDSQRYGASARWRYATSAAKTHSLIYEAEQIQYDNETVNENLLRQDVFLRLDSLQTYNSIQLDLGVTRLERERTGDSTGALVRMNTVRRLTSISTVGLVLAGEYLYAGKLLLATNGSPVSATGGSSPPDTEGGFTNDFFYTKRIEGYYQRNNDHYGLDARAFYRDIDYVFSQEDRRESGGRLEATRDFDNMLTAAAYGSHILIQYLNNPRDDRESEAGIRFRYRIDRHYTATLEGRRTWHYSTDVFQEYTDNRVLVSLSYSSGPLYTPRIELTGGRAAPSFPVRETAPLTTP